MRLHRFIGDFDFNNKKLKIYDDELVGQIRNVLRLKKGDDLILADGKLNEASASIVDFGKGFVEVEISEITENKNEPQIKTTLYCSILKRENFELLAQKATEAGVAKIVPIRTKRTVKINLREDRLAKIMIEAAEQSGRGIVPVLEKTLSLEEALETAKENEINFFFDVSGSNLTAVSKGFNKAGIFIGPEGGWEEREIEMP